MKLKLGEWANLAEIVGAFAVVISLLYVGIQVNDSTSAVRAASANDANVALQAWYLEIGSDQQTSEVFYRALTSPAALPPEEEFQFLMMVHGAFLAFQNSYLLAEEGTLDPEISEAITAAILGVKSLPGTVRYWRQRKSYLHSGFAQYVDELMERDNEVTVDIYKPGETQ